MKKNIGLLFSTFILLVLLSGCAVNTYTGKITIVNQTATPITNVKIGSTVLTFSVYPGQTVDYWYSFPVEGKLSIEGVDYPNRYGKDPNGDSVYTALDSLKYEFKPNMWVVFTVLNEKDSDGTAVSGENVPRGSSVLTLLVTKQDSNSSTLANDYCSE